jgi:competence protein ComEC
LLVAAVFSFATGIYLGALQNIPLKFILPPLVLIVLFVPFVIKKNRYLASLLIIACFVLAGITRIEIASISQSITINPGKDIYEGLVTESSQNVKIVSLTHPADYSFLKVTVRTSETLNINDTVRIFGELREIYPTFKNPYVPSWKWLKRLEGVSYDLRGNIVSVVPGTHYIHSIRNTLKHKIDTSGAQHAGIIKALTIGDTTGLDEETKKLFLTTGTSHILAISGSNIGIVTAFIFFMARLFIGRIRALRLRGDDTRYAAIITIPFAFAFMLIAGSSIPTVRATLMITVFMLSLYFERGRDIFSTVALSALIILLVYPHSLFTPSFQLTFASVVFIILFSQRMVPLIKTENRLLRWLLLSAGMTVSATIGTLPVVLYHFYGVNFFAVFHNLVAVPLMCIVAMPLGLLGVVLPWGEHLLRFAGEVLTLTINILKVLNWGYMYPLIRPNLFEIFLYFAFVLVLFHINKKLVFALLVFLVLPVTSVYGFYLYRERFNNDLRVNFIDVGNGDSMIVEAPDGMRILIDGGGFQTGDFDVGKSVLTPILLSKKILTLDYVINTHPHGDHLGGIPTILRDFKVNNFSTGSYFVSREKFIDVMKTLKEKRIPIRIWKQGDRIVLENNVRISVLNPGTKIGAEDLNNASLAMIMGYENFSIFFTGDIGSDIEEKLILTGNDLRADVIKIPHHGSRHSSCYEFLASVKPKIAILSVGRGIPGIPSNEALKRYDSFAIPVLRTDRNGMIRVWKDKRGIAYWTQEQHD